MAICSSISYLRSSLKKKLIFPDFLFLCVNLSVKSSKLKPEIQLRTSLINFLDEVLASNYFFYAAST